MSKPVPTLSSDGWLNTVGEKADRLIGYFYYSDASQSNTFKGNITSFPNIIKEYGNDPTQLKSELNEKVQQYLSRYFNEVLVEINVVIPENKADNRMDVSMSVIIKEDGKVYNLSKVLELANNKIVKIIDLNNRGEG